MSAAIACSDAGGSSRPAARPDGLYVPVRARQRIQPEGGQVRLVMCGAEVLRIFVVTGIDGLIPTSAAVRFVSR
jgi:hypothetical protein